MNLDDTISGYFFIFLLLSPMIINSYAVPVDQLKLFETSQNSIIYDSDIINIDSNFFFENNFKRYLIFGSNLPQTNILENNSN